MSRADRRLLTETRAGRRQLRLAATLGLGSAVAVVAQAVLLAHIIAAAAFHHRTLAQLTSSMVALAGVLAVRALLSGGFEVSGRLGAIRVMSELRGRLADQLLVRSPMAREGEATGELATAVVQGVESLEAYFAGYLPQAVLAAAVPIAVLAWVTLHDPIAGAALLLSVPLLIVFMILVGKGAQAHARSRWQALALLSGHFLDVVRGLPTLRAFRREDAQAQTIERVADRYRAETMGTLRVAFLSALVLELCAMIGTALVAATIGLQLDNGQLTLQEGLAVLLLCPELYGPLRSLGQQFHASADGFAAAERILSVLDEPPTVLAPTRPDTTSALVPDPRRVAVCFEAVSFTYPGRTSPVLDGCSLTLAPGRLTALLGPSGAGKSTIAALALRLADPSAGRIVCGGTDLRELAAEEWRRQLAWVPQRTRLFTGTLAENISLGTPRATPAEISHAAYQACLHELLVDLPDGLDTRIGEGGRGLSAGQAGRVGLARAFLRDAGLLVLDEPTAHLDPATAHSLGDAIARLCAGRTALLIAHDLELVARADHVLTLSHGQALGRAQPAMAAA